MALVLCPSHRLDAVGSTINFSPGYSYKGALCGRDWAGDNRVLLVVSARVKGCEMVVEAVIEIQQDLQWFLTGINLASMFREV